MRIMELLNVRWRRLSTIPGFSQFKDYAVDATGAVYSFKCGKVKKIRPIPTGKYKKHFEVTLYHNKTKKKVYVHKLVAIAFLDTKDTSQPVTHKNGFADNSVLNVEWKYDDNAEEEVFKEKCRKVYELSLKKGLSLPTFNDFYTNLLNEAIENHINKYGLKKILHQEGLST